jgi:hypothetical protein
MKVPPAHHPKDEDLNQANAWKRHRRSGAVESADLTKNDGRRYKWNHPTRKQGSTKIPVTKELKMKSTETLTLLK